MGLRILLLFVSQEKRGACVEWKWVGNIEKGMKRRRRRRLMGQFGPFSCMRMGMIGSLWFWVPLEQLVKAWVPLWCCISVAAWWITLGLHLPCHQTLSSITSIRFSVSLSLSLSDRSLNTHTDGYEKLIRANNLLGLALILVMQNAVAWLCLAGASFLVCFLGEFHHFNLLYIDDFDWSYFPLSSCFHLHLFNLF